MDIPLAQISPALLGLVGSLLAGLMTGVGAVPVLFGRVPSREMRDMALGFAAGVMLSASFFSLIIPALDAAAMRYGEGAAPAAIACLGILIGMAAVAALNEVLPHEHFRSGREGLRPAWCGGSGSSSRRSRSKTFPRDWPSASGSAPKGSRQGCRSRSASACRMLRRGWRSLWRCSGSAIRGGMPSPSRRLPA